MAIKLIANYSKRLGLPGYSSHQFEVSVESELSSLENINREAEHLYSILQASVDAQIQEVGFVPGINYGTESAGQPTSSPATPESVAKQSPPWKCSDKQRELILDIITKNKIEKKTLNDLSIERFGKHVTQLNKLEASSLIDELLEKVGSGKGKRQTTSAPNNYTKQTYAHQS